MNEVEYGVMVVKGEGLPYQLWLCKKTGQVGYRLSNMKYISWYWSSEEKFLHWLDDSKLWSFSAEGPFEGNV